MGEYLPWVLMPTAQADHAQETVRAWQAAGYRVAIFIDTALKITNTDMVMGAVRYPGVWNAANALARRVAEMELAGGPAICLFAGDDMDPDPRKSGPGIAREYLERFPDGGGIMQPCGDAQGLESWESYVTRCPEDAAALARSGFRAGDPVPASARICGSAWFGREWIKRAYRGKGPTDGRYHHFYGDESLACVATKLGRIWWRPDLTQFHRHWSFGHMARQPYHDKNQERWNADKKLFDESKAAGFPEGAWA